MERFQRDLKKEKDIAKPIKEIPLGIFCNSCQDFTEQVLIDKKWSKLDPRFVLTTFRCHECNGTNYDFKRVV